MRASSRITLALVLVGTVAAALAASAGARIDDRGSGFKTSEPAMLEGVGGTKVKPLMTVGRLAQERLSIRGHPGRHLGEPTRPRPGSTSTSTTRTFRPSRSRTWRPARPSTTHSTTSTMLSSASSSLSRDFARVLSGKLVIKSSENFQRFCSNFLATKATLYETSCSPMKRRRTSSTGAAGPGRRSPGDPAAPAGRRGRGL